MMTYYVLRRIDSGIRARTWEGKVSELLPFDLSQATDDMSGGSLLHVDDGRTDLIRGRVMADGSKVCGPHFHAVSLFVED